MATEAFIDEQLGKENAEKVSTVVLHFMRHAEKEVDKTKNDYDISLSEKGKHQAVEKSGDTNIMQSVAYGSPRKRTQETAAFAMSGNMDEIEGNETFNELKEKLNENLEVGSKIGTDDRLNFNDDFSTEYGKAALDAFKKGYFLKFLVEESDKLAEETGDLNGSTYSRMAKGVAEIVLKYVKVSSRWHELVNDPSKNYSGELQRFFGSHQGLLECFLAKVIDKTKGEEEKNKFVDLLGNKGFDFAEGFDISISEGANPEDLKIHITYKKDNPEGETFVVDEYINTELLEEIAK